MREAHARGERASDLVAQTLDVRSANQNIDPAARGPQPANANEPAAADRATGTGAAAPLSRGEQTPIEVTFPQAAIEPQIDPGLATIAAEAGPVPSVDREELVAARGADIALTGAADAGAGAIGGLASYLADELGEMFAPTPPEVREARAKAAAEAEAQKPVADNPYLKHATTAKEMTETERDDKARDEYWDRERERRRER